MTPAAVGRLLVLVARGAGVVAMAPVSDEDEVQVDLLDRANGAEAATLRAERGGASWRVSLAGVSWSSVPDNADSICEAAGGLLAAWLAARTE